MKTSESFAMRPRLRPLISAVAAVFSALMCPAALAAAAEGRCPAVTVEADTRVRSAFPDGIDRIQSEFTARPDVDACAHVGLRLRDDGAIEVSVALPDGRTSSRTVAEPEDVVPTLQALLLIPVPAPAPREEPAETPPLVTAPSTTTARVDEPSDSKRGAISTEERALGVELSALMGARAGDGQVAYGAGAFSLIEVNGWLFGFEGRIDAYQTTSGGDPESALELALLVGRRVYFDSVALDLSAGPAVAMKGIASTGSVWVERRSSAMPPPPQPEPAEPTTGPLPRLLVGARLGFAPRSVLRAFVGFEAELGPSQGNDDPGELQRNAASLPRLPRYTAGFVVGATVGTL
jgi:hypothetical protein